MDPNTLLAFQKALLAGSSCAMSSFILNPIDVTKTRMMNQVGKATTEAIKPPTGTVASAAVSASAEASASATFSFSLGGSKGHNASLGGSIGAKASTSGNVVPRYNGFLEGLLSIGRTEGLRGWGRGLEPSMMREMTYSSCRMGAYEPIKSTLMTLTADTSEADGSNTKGDVSPFVKFGSALISGGIGAAATNPFDLVKTRFQAAFPGQAPLPYSNTYQAFKYIYKHEGGLRNGLYKAWEATSLRAAFLTSGQLGE